jgi:hypothetical protein
VGSTGLDGAPDARERQDDVARVRVEVVEEAADPVGERVHVVATRDRIEDLRRRRPDQRPVAAQHHRHERCEIGTRCDRPRLELAALEAIPQPVAVLKVESRRIPPGADLRLDDDRQVDRPRPP